MKERLKTIGQWIGLGTVALCGIITSAMLGYFVLLYTVYSVRNVFISTTHQVENQSLYVAEADGQSSLQYIYFKDGFAAIFQGGKDGAWGEYALQEVQFHKWDWFLPGLYVKPGEFLYFFGLRIVDAESTPMTMLWKTRYNMSYRCGKRFVERSPRYTTVLFYDDCIVIEGKKHRKVDMKNAPIFVRSLDEIINSKPKN